MSKYEPLHKYLVGIPATHADVTLRFSDLERILGARLPVSAHIHRPWWSNEIGGRHVQAHAWLHAGWIVDSVDLAGQWVRFRRAG